MLLIDRPRFAALVESVVLVATQVTDTRGLRVTPDIPGRCVDPSDPMTWSYDMERVASIVLGALVALVNGPVMVADEEDV